MGKTGFKLGICIAMGVAAGGAMGASAGGIEDLGGNYELAARDSSRCPRRFSIDVQGSGVLRVTRFMGDGDPGASVSLARGAGSTSSDGLSTEHSVRFDGGTLSERLEWGECFMPYIFCDFHMKVLEEWRLQDAKTLRYSKSVSGDDEYAYSCSYSRQ